VIGARARRVVRARLERSSLRVLLTVGMLAILAASFAAIGVATSLGLRSWMINEIDDGLRATLPPSHSGEWNPGERPLVPVGGPFGRGNVVIVIDSAGATPLSGDVPTDTLSAGSIEVLRQVESTGATEPRTVDIPGLGESRVLTASSRSGNLLVAIAPLEPVANVADTLAVVEAFVLAGALVGAGALSWSLVGLALRPLDRVAQAAGEVASLPLDQGDVDIPMRVPAAGAGREVIQVAAAVNRMLDHVESSLRARNRTEGRLRAFVADAGHELRTPLASVRGYAELVRRTPTTNVDEIATSGERIERAADRMSRLVEDLLALAAIDDGAPLELVRVDLREIVGDVVAEAMPTAGDARLVVDEGEPIMIAVDAARLHQAVANLVSNSIAQSPPGGTIRVTCRHESRFARVEVLDEGPGFPPGLVATATERFTRGDPSRARRTGGAGLGLAIARAITESHGGRISLGNRTDRSGAWVRIDIPVD